MPPSEFGKGKIYSAFLQAPPHNKKKGIKEKIRVQK